MTNNYHYRPDDAHRAIDAAASIRRQSYTALANVAAVTTDQEIADATVAALCMIAEQLAVLTAVTHANSEAIQNIAAKIYDRNLLEEQRFNEARKTQQPDTDSRPTW